MTSTMEQVPPEQQLSAGGSAKILSHSISITNVTDIEKEQIVHEARKTVSTTVADIENEEGILVPCKNVAPIGPHAHRYSNMCSASQGAKTLFATDDWFACADNLLKDTPPLFDPDAYCEQGKVLDGWETRRRREEGHDWCLIQLSARAEILALELDTAHFTGNQVPKVSIEIADLTSAELSGLVKKIPNAFERMLHGGVQGTGHTPEEVKEALDAVQTVSWSPLLPTTSLLPGYENTRMHRVSFEQAKLGTLVKVNYFPDGGVARLKLWGNSLGEVKPATQPLYMPIETGPVCTVVKHSSAGKLPSRMPYEHDEVSSLELGGTGVACSNKHYGEPWRLLQVSLGKDMGDGWETARHPSRPAVLIKDQKTHLIDSPLMDWAILKLGIFATQGVRRIILDTKHFRGNYPESVLLEGCYCPNEEKEAEWFPLVQRTRMSPDAEHLFDRSKDQISNAFRPVSHVRLSIFPDGGVSRVRIYA